MIKRIFTEEHKRKIGLANSIALKGKHYPNNFKKGCIPWNKGKKTGIKPTNAFKEGHKNLHIKKGIFKNCITCGKKFYVSKSLMRIKCCSIRCSKLGIIPWNKGKKLPQFSGKNACNWQGGKSFETYGKEFNSNLRESIRFRDKYKCQICGCSQMENIKRLCIHHIDYDKKNNNFNNLTSLCFLCHMKTNGNRKYWTDFFQSILNKKEYV